MRRQSEWYKALSKWLNDKPYTKAMYINACATMIMAVMSVIMCITVFQNGKSLKFAARSLAQTDESLRLTRESVESGKNALRVASDSLAIQKDEFRLRNRPILICTSPRFGGASTDAESKVHPRSIILDLRNLTEVPATHVFGTSEMVFDGKKTRGSTLDLGVLVGDPLKCTPSSRQK
jgi:hypothetical protein